ncbi:hypothetical protein GVAV_002037 [Gurleya vavrai]
MAHKNPALLKIQDKLNQNFIEYAKKEFIFHLENYRDIEPLLIERKLIIENNELFWANALKNTELNNSNNKIYEFVENLEVKYEDDFWCSVELNLKENDFTKNLKLKKRFNVMTEELEVIQPVYKIKTESELLEFFETEEVDVDMFDTLYDIFVNAISYYHIGN